MEFNNYAYALRPLACDKPCEALQKKACNPEAFGRGRQKRNLGYNY